MPIYEYQCEHCGKTSEHIQKVNDPIIQNCPFCDSNELKKIVSSTSFQLKGSGWYVTDFRDKGKKSSAPSEKKESKDTKDKTK